MEQVLEIFDFPRSAELIAFTVGSLAAAVYAFAVARIIVRTRTRQERKEEKTERDRFFSALRAGLRARTIENPEDIINIYRGTASLGDEDLDYRRGLNQWLRTFLVDVIVESGSGDNPIPDVVEWKESLSQIIAENDEVSPFADLPPLERNMLADITAFLKKGDNDSITRKLEEVAASVRARDDTVKRLTSMNGLTTGLACAGLVLTIIFGLLALK